ncbi:MAG: hypothetical protein DRR11_14820 [Gammaproteobacteria bacterium]|nr:MAG: hypothetical protein DRR11_14820 [Gammaproteobacteria bacterium]
MRSAFGAWLVERRLVRIALIAVLLPLFGVISAAVVVCVTVVKGWRESLADCLVALVLVVGLTVMAGEGLPQILFSSVSTWGIAVLMGGLTGIYGVLTLAVQVFVLLCCIAIIGFAVLVDDPLGFWQPILSLIVEQMQLLQVEFTDPNAIMALAPIMSGLFVAGMVASSIVALLLGCWWAGGAKGVSFRELFIGLRFGYVIGGIAAVAGVGSLLGFQPLAGNLLLVAGIGFLFQGLAVVHWHVVRRGLPGVVLIPVYLPLFMGPSILILALFLFAAIGFIDNWYGLRRAKII